MHRDLESSKQKFEILSKQYEELEAKSRADRKILVKEVKSLRTLQLKLEHDLSKSNEEKSEAEVFQYLFTSWDSKLSIFVELPLFHFNTINIR